MVLIALEESAAEPLIENVRGNSSKTVATSELKLRVNLTVYDHPMHELSSKSKT